MLREEKELLKMMPLGVTVYDAASVKAMRKKVRALVKAVREDERKIKSRRAVVIVMRDPKNWPDWKIAFAADVYGVPVEKMAAAIRGRK